MLEVLGDLPEFPGAGLYHPQLAWCVRCPAVRQRQTVTSHLQRLFSWPLDEGLVRICTHACADLPSWPP